MRMTINEVDKVEILTLQDNYIDLISRDNTEIVQRARLVKGSKMRGSILAEHGFSALVTVTTGENSRSILFDSGFSEHGAGNKGKHFGKPLDERLQKLIIFLSLNLLCSISGLIIWGQSLY